MTDPLALASASDDPWHHRLWPSRKVEAFVVSFPKSGRTWLRVLMGVAEARARPAETETVVREWLEQEAPHLRGRALLFTHALSANAHERAAAMGHFLGYIGDRRRLFLVRDPRDTIVSYFFQVVKRQRRPFRGAEEITEFVRDPGYGIERILAFLRACDDSLRRDPGPAMLTSYEELHRDPKVTLREALEFFEAGATEDVLDDAVAFGTFENMRRLEVTGAFSEPSRRLTARDLEDPESLKTRRGMVGSFREYLRDRDVAYVEERIAALMPPALGYLEAGVPPPTRIREGPG